MSWVEGFDVTGAGVLVAAEFADRGSYGVIVQRGDQCGRGPQRFRAEYEVVVLPDQRDEGADPAIRQERARRQGCCRTTSGTC